MAPIEHDELNSLLAVYSLDALPADEAALVEDHLAGCPGCQAELGALREVAGLLGSSGASAPEGGWDRIARELSVPPVSPRQPLPASEVVGPAQLPGAPLPGAHQRRRPSAWRAGAFGLAAVLAVVVGVLSYRVVDLNNRVDQLQSALRNEGTGQLVALALANPDHKAVLLTTKSSSLHALVVVLPDGHAYWVEDDLSALPASSTYQLWALSSGKAVSLGVMGREPSDVAFLVEVPMTQLMVTAEPVGGVPAPTTPVLVSGALSV
jgi:Anti-sigma-K factor rskA/Putative zinc-finger